MHPWIITLILKTFLFQLSSSALDTTGPFLVLNAFRMLPPDATHTMLVSFTPAAGRVFQEVLNINTTMASLHLTLVGKGVSPIVSLTAVENGLFDMGAVLAGEYVEKTFKVREGWDLKCSCKIISLDFDSSVANKNENK